MTSIRNILACSLAAFSLLLSAVAQETIDTHRPPATQDIINTVIGGGPNGMPAIDANIYAPQGMAFDKQGNYYYASQYLCRVFKVNPTSGVVTVAAGNGFCGYSGDGGLAAAAMLAYPQGVAVDGANPPNIYIADSNNFAIRKITGSTGVISTIAGVPGFAGYNGDGIAANTAWLYYPIGVAVNSTNSDIYIADQDNGRIRKVPGGVGTATITTVAGGGTGSGYANCQSTIPFGDGAAATSSFLCYPQYISLDTSVTPPHIFFTSYGGNNCTVREVVGGTKTAAGNIYLLAGAYYTGLAGTGCGFNDNVTATAGQFNGAYQLQAVVSGATTTVTVADYYNARIRSFPLTYSSSGVPTPTTLTTTAGKGTGGFCGDGGSALLACMNPVGVAFDSTGNTFIGDYGSERIREVTKSTGNISTSAGWGGLYYPNPVNNNGLAGLALGLYGPFGIYIDSHNNMFLSGDSDQTVHELLASSGLVNTFAGNGQAGYENGTTATAANTYLNAPVAAVADSNGNVFLADYNNCDIRQVTPSGTITTYVGGTISVANGCGFSGDGGAAASAKISGPIGLAVDSSNNLYIADSNNCVIRKVTASTGIISTVAGTAPDVNGTHCGFSGDSGVATSAQLYTPYGIAFGNEGDMFIVDYNNQRVRKVDGSTGTITTFAGTGTAGYTGDGQATSIDLYYPSGITADANGNVFIADRTNQLLRWIDPTGYLITFAGTPPYLSGFTGDGGPALSAKLDNPYGIALDSSANIYTVDFTNVRVRQVSAFSAMGRSASSVDFPIQAVGTTSNPQSVVISALGPLTITSISVTSQFSEIDNCPAVLAALQNCTVDVFFTPTAGGDVNGTLTIKNNSFFTTSPNTVALSAEATALSTTGSLAFGTVQINTTVAKTVTLKNSGTTSVSLTSITLTQTTDFSFGAGTCSLSGGSLAAGKTCTIIVNFKPLTNGAKKSTLVVSSKDPASPLFVAATGTGTSVEITPSTLAFGNVAHGTTSLPQNVTLTNVGTSSFTVATSITGTNASSFIIVPAGTTCGSSLAAGASCIIQVEFSPATAGSDTASLKVTTNASYNPTVALTGTGT